MLLASSDRIESVRRVCVCVCVCTCVCLSYSKLGYGQLEVKLDTAHECYEKRIEEKSREERSR